MLEKIDLTKSLKKKEYKKRMAKLESKIAFLQRELKNLGVPVMIVFEGFGAAGKGTQINRLIQALDPRGFTVYSTDAETKDEKMHPFLWRFWTKTPEKGRIAVFDRSWYRKLLVDRYEKKTSKKEIPIILEEISSFEKQLTDGGTLVMKFFLDISEREQKKRFHKLMEKKATSWRVSDKDLDRNKHFQDYLEMADEMLTKTDSDYAPWTIVEAEDDRYATVKILSTVAAAFEDRYKKEKEFKKKEREVDGRFDKSELNDSVLKKVDLSKKMEEKAYEKRLDELQKKLRLLHGKLYAKRIPVVLAFEGWDAGGKGGAIKRLTNALDPRAVSYTHLTLPTK